MRQSYKPQRERRPGRFIGREKLQIDINSPAMDVRLVVISVVVVAVTGLLHQRHCPMSRYQSVSSADIRVIRQLQNEHEKDMSTTAIKCYRRMMRHKPSVCDLMTSDRLIFILERVSQTLDVLQSKSTSGATDLGSQSLMIFLKLRDDLTICKESSEISETPSDELKAWFHHLQHFKDKESSQCLQDAVLLGLIPLLVQDVACWAHGN
ncbi:interferon lambda-3-like [Ranitomeya variabilis]|uniref:interferon lambda-3-like n=1 Tax=Ranitomeya variabilis TaxID=490064 RepID=UPI004056AECE